LFSMMWERWAVSWWAAWFLVGDCRALFRKAGKAFRGCGRLDRLALRVELWLKKPPVTWIFSSSNACCGDRLAPVGLPGCGLWRASSGRGVSLRAGVLAALVGFSGCCGSDPSSSSNAVRPPPSALVVLPSAKASSVSSTPIAVLKPETSAKVVSSVSDEKVISPPAKIIPLVPWFDTKDPAAAHFTDRADLLKLIKLAELSKKDRQRHNADLFLGKNLGTDTPSKFNQGNKEIAKHERSYEQCMKGLENVVLQTEEQQKTCGGHEYMVPIYRDGDPKKAKYCIDVFEFPNKPCQIPMVWVSPIQAKEMCFLQGKRLCSQEEWIRSCRADPEGGSDSIYAYGDQMDLTICNTNKHGGGPKEGEKCNPRSAKTAWKTCRTDTEPAGSFPQCRSRFGVFDQHGNVAEIMTRRDKDGHLYSQLKGSAFFYVDVERKHDQPAPKKPKRETYPDHCAYNPRWHVERMSEAWHVNYHLGFRCCVSVKHG
jgi:formylglycine-generating enzyme